MIRRLKTGALTVLAILLFGISACGQMGPLSLPDDIVDDNDDNSDAENER